jgi:hypothetical protein
MGADWYSPCLFFGVRFPLHHVKAFHSEIQELIAHTSFQVCLYEEAKHSRCEGEEISDLLERCEGFFGLTSFTFNLQTLLPIEAQFLAFMETHKELLSKYEVQGTPRLSAGFDHDIEYLDY